jgi:hypothetical protein
VRAVVGEHCAGRARRARRQHPLDALATRVVQRAALHIEPGLGESMPRRSGDVQLACSSREMGATALRHDEGRGREPGQEEQRDGESPAQPDSASHRTRIYAIWPQPGFFLRIAHTSQGAKTRYHP